MTDKVTPPPKTPKKRTGPKMAKLADLTDFAASLDKLSPAERKAHRTKAAEITMDLFMSRLQTMLASDTCRAQTMICASQFLRSNDFVVSPDTDGEIDPLQRIINQKREAEKAEQIRLRNIEREKKKRIAAEEARSVAFFQKLDNPTEPTPRLNTKAPGRLTNDDNNDTEGDFNDE